MELFNTLWVHAVSVQPKAAIGLKRVGRMTDKPIKSSSQSAMEIQTHKKPGARLSREIQGRIGNNLRSMYEDIVRQGVPDRFAELLQKLDTQQPEGAAATPEDAGE
jgi:hypothetical protein